MYDQQTAVPYTKLPKVDLHLHLDGSVKPETLLDLALEKGVSLPPRQVEIISTYMKIHGDCASLSDYLSKFAFVNTFLQTAEALERVAYEVVEQSAGQHCKYIEVRFAPQLHRGNGMSLDEVIYHVVKGLPRRPPRVGQFIPSAVTSRKAFM